MSYEILSESYGRRLPKIIAEADSTDDLATLGTNYAEGSVCTISGKAYKLDKVHGWVDPSSGGGGGGELFVATYTYDEDEDSWSCDKTFDEIWAAYQAGESVAAEYYDDSYEGIVRLTETMWWDTANPGVQFDGATFYTTDPGIHTDYFQIYHEKYSGEDVISVYNGAAYIPESEDPYVLYFDVDIPVGTSSYVLTMESGTDPDDCFAEVSGGRPIKANASILGKTGINMEPTFTQVSYAGIGILDSVNTGFMADVDGNILYITIRAIATQAGTPGYWDTSVVQLYPTT